MPVNLSFFRRQQKSVYLVSKYKKAFFPVMRQDPDYGSNLYTVKKNLSVAKIRDQPRLSSAFGLGDMTLCS